jgi:spore germination protein YaaH
VRPASLAVIAALLVFANGARAQVGGHTIVGYYVPYDSSSWASLEAHAGQLTMVAAQWATIDACGDIGSRDDETLKQFAHDHGLTVEPSLFTVSAWLNHAILTDDQARANAIQSIVAYTEWGNYGGFDLDLEGVDPSDRQAFSDFVADLGSALHDRGKSLTLALPPKERDTTVGWAGAYDYAALGPSADLVTIMAYEYRGPFSGPGSVAPYAWVERAAQFASQQIEPDKVLLGLAFYGYDWNTTSGGTRSVGYPNAMAIAQAYAAEPSFDSTQQSLTFSYSSVAGEQVSIPRVELPITMGAHRITTREPPACDVEAPPPPPAPTRVPDLPPGTPEDHQVWLEEAGSAAARLPLVDRYGLAGVAAWRLGLEDPGVWSLFAGWQAGDQGR